MVVLVLLFGRFVGCAGFQGFDASAQRGEFCREAADDLGQRLDRGFGTVVVPRTVPGHELVVVHRASTTFAA
ncbi:hypothetical protein [Saccharopolyspora gloriosae]|uniref:hypothetical protein n=1 Tax=Saccharopolyspora gloriosae TaxID=455344 RepID=UPI001FB6FA6F|nr:hypothetical protein [Saccharopolyspora gloriosae]